jgi:ABC-type glycerol-3-phosphate transport system permease component
MYWMVISAIRPNSESFTTQLRFLPMKLTAENYNYVKSAIPLAKIYFNSIFVSVSRTLLTLFFASLAGFAFAKLRFKGRSVIFIFVLFTMTIPFDSIVLPSFMIMVAVKWVNTYWPLIIPHAADAFGIFLMRQYIVTVPTELIESARIDGCSFFRIYRSIVVPIVIPAFITLAIFIFRSSWNDFLWPLIIIREPAKQMLMVAINSLPPNDPVIRDIPWGATMAAACLACIPPLVLFLSLQRYFIPDAMRGSIK